MNNDCDEICIQFAAEVQLLNAVQGKEGLLENLVVSIRCTDYFLRQHYEDWCINLSIFGEVSGASSLLLSIHAGNSLMYLRSGNRAICAVLDCST